MDNERIQGIVKTALLMDTEEELLAYLKTLNSVDIAAVTSIMQVLVGALLVEIIGVQED